MDFNKLLKTMDALDQPATPKKEKLDEAQIRLDITGLESEDANTLSQMLALAGVAQDTAPMGAEPAMDMGADQAVDMADPMAVDSHEHEPFDADMDGDHDHEDHHMDGMDIDVADDPGVMGPEDDKMVMQSAFEAALDDEDEITETESKPDFADLDGDGDKEEPMKKATKDAEEDEELEESLEDLLALAGQMMQVTEEDEEALDETWANEPDPKLHPEVPSGGPNRAQGSYKATAGGDNPMAVRESSLRAKLANFKSN